MRRVAPLLLLAALLGLPVAAFAEDVGAALERRYGVVADPVMSVRLNTVGARIAAAVRQDYPKLRDKAFAFNILRNPDLNAMALPDGRIYVTSGMMQALASRPDDELAAVLGHEATHVAQRHSGNQKRQAILGAVLGGALGRAVGGSGAVSQGVQLGAGLNGARYSRDDEYRADAGSVQLLRTAGYDPYATGRLLELLRKGDGPAPAAATAAIGWFASHPDTAKRIESANRAADQVTGRRR